MTNQELGYGVTFIASHFDYLHNFVQTICFSHFEVTNPNVDIQKSFVVESGIFLNLSS